MTNWHAPIGGWMDGLSDRGRAHVLKELKGVDADKVDQEAAYYRIFKVGIRQQPSPKEMRLQIQALQTKASALLEVLGNTQKAGLTSLINQCGVKIAECPDTAELEGGLRRLLHALPKAKSYVPKGQRRNPRNYLVSQLAALVSAAGHVVDARPMGALCKLTGIVLEDVGEKPSDIPKIVRPVAACWSKVAKTKPVDSN